MIASLNWFCLHCKTSELSWTETESLWIAAFHQATEFQLNFRASCLCSVGHVMEAELLSPLYAPFCAGVFEFPGEQADFVCFLHSLHAE